MTVGPIAQPDTQEGERQGEKRRGHFDNTRCRTSRNATPRGDATSPPGTATLNPESAPAEE